jgi:hypothetical protein
VCFIESCSVCAIPVRAEQKQKAAYKSKRTVSDRVVPLYCRVSWQRHRVEHKQTCWEVMVDVSLVQKVERLKRQLRGIAEKHKIIEQTIPGHPSIVRHTDIISLFHVHEINEDCSNLSGG